MQGRVSAEYRASYDVLIDGVVVSASLRGSFHDDAGGAFPKVGDYVEVSPVEVGKVVIEAIIPRKNVIARIAPHDGIPQVMVANVDYLLIVMGLDGDFSIPRLERYIALALQSEVVPVVVLNKADVATELATQVALVTDAAPDLAVHVVSAVTGAGMEALSPYTDAGKTVVLLGSSGAGKSTITNWLVAAAAQPTQALRERDGRGRHTTTHRQLFVLPSGGFLIDTPGMRELALLDEAEGAADAFGDLHALSLTCRFSNCDHEKSAGCALQAGLQNGTIDPERFLRYRKLRDGEERVRRVRY